MIDNRFSRTLNARMLAAIALAVIGLTAALSAALVVTRNYRSSRDLIEPAEVSPLLRQPERTGVADLKNISFASQDGARLAGWYVPSKNRAAIIVTHGTNADRSTMLPELRFLADAGFGVLAFDWPGLGESEGRILWGDGARRALICAIDWLASKGDVDADRIGGLGFSIGGFVMTQVAAVDPRLRAIVLEGTVTGFDAYMNLHHGRWGVLSQWPARWAIRRTGLLDPAWAPGRVIGAIAPRPVLLISGSQDTEIPATMVRELYSSAHQPKTLWVVPGAEHGNYALAAPVDYPRRVIDFFNRTLVGPTGAVP